MTNNEIELFGVYVLNRSKLYALFRNEGDAKSLVNYWTELGLGLFEIRKIISSDRILWLVL